MATIFREANIIKNRNSPVSIDMNRKKTSARDSTHCLKSLKSSINKNKAALNKWHINMRSLKQNIVSFRKSSHHDRSRHHHHHHKLASMISHIIKKQSLQVTFPNTIGIFIHISSIMGSRDLLNEWCTNTLVSTCQDNNIQPHALRSYAKQYV